MHVYLIILKPGFFRLKEEDGAALCNLYPYLRPARVYNTCK